MIRGMGSINHVAHKMVSELFDDPVEITEKIDGSFISFGVDDNDELQMRSKGQELFYDAPSSGLFKAGMDAIRERADLLVPGWVWRGEYLAKPKHNSLCYDRIPQGHIIIFDVEVSLGHHLDPDARLHEASFIGFETVPVLHWGPWEEGIPGLKKFLDLTSCLGGQKIEGVVVKNSSKDLNGHMMMGKLVSDQFKEVHTKSWKEANPNKGDVVQELINAYKTEARWRKAVQHLEERGELTNSPKDIGPLLKEVSQDVLKEEEEEIKNALFKLCWPKISRGIGSGLPDWYKSLLESE